jgi:NADH-quinone oxidoreductase subunit M
LAGLLLKLGGYGFIRILIPILPEATLFYAPLADTFAIVSITYASLTTMRQIDLKRIIAYSSIAHMNSVVLGIFSGSIEGLSGGIFLMIAHGIVSSALFFLIGILYDKYGTRLICYYGGLVQTMPVFSTYLLVFCLANIGLPGTCNFVGELVVFSGLVEKNMVALLVSITGVIFSTVYTMFLFNRITFGNLNVIYITTFIDITRRELYTLMPLVMLTIILGIFPDLIFDTTLASVSMLIEKSKLI